MPSLTRSSTKQRQTRLDFTPIPSSSPTAARYPSPIRDRVAEVRYDDPSTPVKKRRLYNSPHGPISRPGDPHEHLVTPGKSSSFAVVIHTPSKQHKANMDAPSMLPTPVKSSQVELVGSNRVTSADSDTSSETETNNQVITNTFKRRMRANDHPEQTDGPSTPESNHHVTNGQGQSTSHKSLNLRAGLKQSRLDLSMLPAGASPPTQSQPRGKTSRDISSPIDLDSHSASSCDDAIVPATAKGRRVRNRTIAISSDESEASDSDLEGPFRSSRRVPILAGNVNNTPYDQSTLKKAFYVNSRHFLLVGSTGNAPIPGSRLSKSVTSKSPPSKAKSTSQRRLRNLAANDNAGSLKRYKTRSTAGARPKMSQPLTNFVSLDEDEDDSDIVLRSPEKRKRRGVSRRPSKTDDVDIGDESSEDEVRPMRIKRRDRFAHSALEDTGESDDQPRHESTPVKSSSQQEQEDLEEDLDDLQEISVQKGRTRERVGSSKKNEKQRQLELLRRRRAGEKIVDLSSDSDQDALPKRALYDSETQDDTLLGRSNDDEFVDLDDSGTEAVRQSLRADADEYDDDFVVDDDHTLGAPSGLEGMPLEFTRHAHKKQVEHFKDAVEWMVQKKLNPAFTRNDPVYQTAFFKLDDEVKGYSSSKFMSAAWGSEFSRALRARPAFYEMEVPTMFDHKCDACNRSGHPAKYKITFGGKAYNHVSLEDVSDNEEDEESGDDGNSYDSRGNAIPGVEVEYYVGRFCKANAETAHALSHWRYHLNQWVLDWLQAEGYTSAEKILQREKWSIRKKRDYANEVVDTMEQKGEIKALYRDFKHNLEAAREAKPSRYHTR